jgi:hypothetical protein
MKRLLLALTLLASLAPAPSRAQVEMSVEIGLPVAPPLVVVQPGIQVVENAGEEVFFVNGWYWCRRGDFWYRARTPRASFVYVEPHFVPYRLSYLPPPGHYRHWRREQLREERHWWREHDRERRSAWKEHQYAQRHGWRGEGGPGRGPGYAPAPARGHAYAPAPARVAPAPAPAPGRGGHAYAAAPARAAPAPARGAHGGNDPHAGHGGGGHDHDHGDHHHH